MKRLNVLFSLSSLSVVLVTIERFSFTTRVLLQPHNFLRLHEAIQITAIILLTVVLPFLVFVEVSQNFRGFQTRSGLLLALLFVVGVYSYASGNGLHEVASFTLNQYCGPANASTDLCAGLFINDFYTGNILYFAGGTLMVLAVLLLEKTVAGPRFDNGDLAISLVNAAVYALAIFAYAAFDRVLVGLVYAVIVALVADVLWFTVRPLYRSHPVTTYTAAAYTLGAILALAVRLV
jgi:hypothetical protein